MEDKKFMPPPGGKITKKIMDDSRSAFYDRTISKKISDQMVEHLDELYTPHLKKDMSTKLNFPGQDTRQIFEKAGKMNKKRKSKKRKKSTKRKKKQTKSKKKERNLRGGVKRGAEGQGGKCTKKRWAKCPGYAIHQRLCSEPRAQREECDDDGF